MAQAYPKNPSRQLARSLDFRNRRAMRQLAANQNSRLAHRAMMQDILASQLRQRALRRSAVFGFSRLALRAVPYVGLAILVYDLLELLRGPQRQFDPAAHGYELLCGAASGVIVPLSAPCGTTAFWLDTDTGRVWHSPSGDRFITVDNPQQYAFVGGIPAMRGKVSSRWQRLIPPNPDTDPEPYTQSPPLVRPVPGSPFAPVPANLPGTPLFPRPGPAPEPLPTPALPPAVDPIQLPIQQPVPTPKPVPYRAIPYRVVNPFRSPTEQPQRGNDVPNPAPSGVPETGGLPGTGIEFPPTPSGKPRVRSSPHARRPPRRGEKEKKYAMAIRRGSALAIGLSLVTETKDVIDALYDALPDERKRSEYHRHKGLLTPQNKSASLYRYYDEIDIPSALVNLAENQIEDAILGRFGRRAAQASRDLGFDGPGIQTGPAL